jgi:hypothetical protein
LSQTYTTPGLNADGHDQGNKCKSEAHFRVEMTVTMTAIEWVNGGTDFGS